MDNCGKTLNVAKFTYGCFLIPILKDRLPDKLNIKFSRQFGAKNWTIDLLLKYFYEELLAKETCEQLHRNLN